MKLTESQQRALAKLTNDWRDAYDLEESRNTLDALVSRKLAEVKYPVGSGFFRRSTFTIWGWLPLYRLRQRKG